MATKYDVPNSMIQELVKFNELFLKGLTRTNTGNLSFTSDSSSETYNSTTGEEGLLTLLKAALDIYMVTATDINSKAESSDLATYMPLSGGTFTGAVSMGRNNINQPQLKDYSETVVTIGSATGSVALNLANGNVFDVTLIGATTFTFNNPAPNGQACSFTLKINQGATPYAVIYPASVKWDNDAIPDIANASKSYIMVFTTYNGGTRYYGRLAMGGLTT